MRKMTKRLVEARCVAAYMRRVHRRDFSILEGLEFKASEFAKFADGFRETDEDGNQINITEGI